VNFDGLFMPGNSINFNKNTDSGAAQACQPRKRERAEQRIHSEPSPIGVDRVDKAGTALGSYDSTGFEDTSSLRVVTSE